MRFACWITKATDTHLEYVINIVSPQQKWSRERASNIRYTYSTLGVLFVCVCSNYLATVQVCGFSCVVCGVCACEVCVCGVYVCGVFAVCVCGVCLCVCDVYVCVCACVVCVCVVCVCGVCVMFSLRMADTLGNRFSAPVQTGPGAHPASCTMGTGSVPG